MLPKRCQKSACMKALVRIVAHSGTTAIVASRTPAAPVNVPGTSIRPRSVASLSTKVCSAKATTLAAIRPSVA